MAAIYSHGGNRWNIHLASILLKEMRYLVYTAISIKVVHEQSGKVEYGRERLLGIALKIH
jgi:hypothetical protein